MIFSELLTNYKLIDPVQLCTHFKLLPFEIFTYNETQKNYVLLAGKNNPIDILKKYKGPVFISKNDMKAYLNISFENFDKCRTDFEDTISSDLSSTEEKVKSLYNYGDVLVANILNNPDDPELIKGTHFFIKKVIHFSSGDFVVIDRLQRMTDKDKYQFRHSLNVFLTGITFIHFLLKEKFLQLSEQEVSAMALGLFFHDVGMIYIPPEIRLKTGALTTHERDTIQKHPILGFDLLNNMIKQRNVSLSDVNLDIIKYHHERMDGSGYPFKLQGENIPVAARLCSICDVYNALIMDRSYHSSIDSFSACRVLFEEMRNLFDRQLLKYFLILLGPKNQLTQNVENYSEEKLPE